MGLDTYLSYRRNLDGIPKTIHVPTYALNRVLWDWNLSETITPLRFYPNRDPRFDRYKISI